MFHCYGVCKLFSIGGVGVLETGIERTDNTCGFECFTQVVFADTDYDPHFVLFADLDGLCRAAYDRGVLLEFSSIGKETLEISLVGSFSPRRIAECALCHTAIAASVALEYDAMYCVLTALVLCYSGFLGVTPYLHEVGALCAVACTFYFVAVLLRVFVGFGLL